MIIDERTYRIVPGKVDEYLANYEKNGLPLHRMHIGEPIGWFVVVEGGLNQVVHWWGYRSMAEREDKRAALYSDPDWNAYRSHGGELVQYQENRILRPTRFSAFK